MTPWTPEETARLMELVGQGLTQREMAAALGRTMASVHQRLKTLGIKLGRWTPPRNHAWRRYSAGRRA